MFWIWDCFDVYFLGEIMIVVLREIIIIIFFL